MKQIKIKSVLNFGLFSKEEINGYTSLICSKYVKLIAPKLFNKARQTGRTIETNLIISDRVFKGCSIFKCKFLPWEDSIDKVNYWHKDFESFEYVYKAMQCALHKFYYPNGLANSEVRKIYIAIEEDLTEDQ